MKLINKLLIGTPLAIVPMVTPMCLTSCSNLVGLKSYSAECKVEGTGSQTKGYLSLKLQYWKNIKSVTGFDEKYVIVTGNRVTITWPLDVPSGQTSTVKYSGHVLAIATDDTIYTYKLTFVGNVNYVYVSSSEHYYIGSISDFKLSDSTKG